MYLKAARQLWLQSLHDDESLRWNEGLTVRATQTLGNRPIHAPFRTRMAQPGVRCLAVPTNGEDGSCFLQMGRMATSGSATSRLVKGPVKIVSGGERGKDARVSQPRWGMTGEQPPQIG